MFLEVSLVVNDEITTSIGDEEPFRLIFTL